MKRGNTIDCKGRVTNLRFSESGEILAALIAPNELHFWHTTDFEKLGEIVSDGFISGFSLSPDGHSAVIINGVKENGQKVNLTLYDIKSDIKTQHTIDKALFSVSYCGNRMALGRVFQGSKEPSKIDIYDNQFTSRIDELELPVTLFHEFALNLEYCNSVDVLASAGIGAVLWDMSTRTLIWDYATDLSQGKLKEKGLDVWESTCIAISANGEYLAIGHWGTDKGATEKVCIYSIKSKEVLGWFCRGFEAIDSVSLSPNGRYIAATGDNDTNLSKCNPHAKIWDIETGEVIDECQLAGMSAVTFSPNGHFLITGASSPDSIVFWELSPNLMDV
jgi:WD40 repeat protein